MTLPTVTELSNLTCSRNMLLLARVLVAGDAFTLTAHLLEDSTRRDLVKVITGLIDQEIEGDDCDLDTPEMDELANLLLAINPA